jgi:oxazoline/thiazoline dehydrogenase
VSGWEDHLIVRRRETFHAAATSADTVAFSLPRSTVKLKRLDAGVHAALLAMDAESAPLAEIVRTARDTLPDANVARLILELGRLYARGVFSLAVQDGGETMCELTSTNAMASFDLELDRQGRRYRLSRFAIVRREERDLVVESLAAGARLWVRRPELAAVLAALNEPAEEEEVGGRSWGLPVPVLGACLRLMRAGGVIGPVDRNGLLPEDREPDLAVRDPQDLFLHNRSRPDLTSEAVGGTFRHAGVLPPLPAIRLDWTGRQVPLPRPDLNRLLRTDLPLAAAMERRRSRREWADRPLTVEALGEFLYRVFRVKGFMPRDPEQPRSYEATLRPIPSAGGAHDLEVYVAAGRVSGTGRGFFHYHPVRHVLTEVTGAAYPVAAMLHVARASAECPVEPPALIVLSSRFGRLAWKYEGLAYALTLKNVGVAYAAMYLVATAMGLAACALGAGDSAAFGTATGTKPYVESPVGEFMIGPASTP